jgi:hypothetical protein
MCVCQQPAVCKSAFCRFSVCLNSACTVFSCRPPANLSLGIRQSDCLSVCLPSAFPYIFILSSVCLPRIKPVCLSAFRHQSACPQRVVHFSAYSLSSAVYFCLLPTCCLSVCLPASFCFLSVFQPLCVSCLFVSLFLFPVCLPASFCFLSVRQPLTVCLSICQSLSVSCLFGSLFLFPVCSAASYCFLSVRQPLTVCLSVCQHLTVCLSVCQPLTVCLSVCQPLSLSCLFASLFLFPFCSPASSCLPVCLYED